MKLSFRVPAAAVYAGLLATTHTRSEEEHVDYGPECRDKPQHVAVARRDNGRHQFRGHGDRRTA